MAAANGNVEFLKILREKQPEEYNAMLMQKNTEEYIPLHWAVLNQQKDTVNFLLEDNKEQLYVKNSSE